MAQQLRDNPSLDGIELYVSSFDGVCKYTQGELGTRGDKINNPVRPALTSYGGWATDLSAQFPRRARLHVFHIAGGEEVAPLSGIRAFSAYSGGSPPKTLFGQSPGGVGDSGRTAYVARWVALSSPKQERRR